MFVNKNFYLISKAFNKLVNISSCCIVSANKIYYDTTIWCTIKNSTISVDTSLFANVCMFAYASYV